MIYSNPHAKYLKLCLVIDTPSFCNFTPAAYEKFVLKVALGGVTSVQLRFKHESAASIRAFALLLQGVLRELNVPFLINDNVQLAHEIQADGIHLGQTDGCPKEARNLLGSNKIIGLSIESLEELEAANKLDCLNYVAASAVFPSTTKTNCKTFWGLTGLQELSKLSRHPVVAIGGITPHNAGHVIQHGASGVAVVSALQGAIDPHAAAQEFRQIIDKNINLRGCHV